MYLGIDIGTQGMKAQIIDIKASSVVHTEAISFGKDLAEFNCPLGYIVNTDPLVVHCNPLMWVAGIDLLFARMKSKSVPLNLIRAISGSGQQHGSVYLNASFEEVLKNLKQDINLLTQIEGVFSRKTAPIWMDRSTHDECIELYNQFKDRIQRDTGSPPIERFTGPQIMKFFKSNKEEYDKTKYIHVISSFIASLLIGKSAPLDYSDASGTNLFNLSTLTWDKEITNFISPTLLDKLPSLIPSATSIGSICSYYGKYGLSEKAEVIAFAGDNPSSLVGIGASLPGIGGISLGTSDTFFCATQESTLDEGGYGHMMGNPAGGLMKLLCFTNGSLAREKVRSECGISWEEVNKLIAENTIPGNEGNFLLPYFVPESVPLILNPKPIFSGSDKYMKGEERGEVKLRGILESQAIRMKLHIGKVELSKIRVTGGASENKSLCQILADVFEIDIERISVTESAALGAALRAANVEAQILLIDLYKKFIIPIETFKPNKENSEVYKKMLIEYKKLELSYKDYM